MRDYLNFNSKGFESGLISPALAALMRYEKVVKLLLVRDVIDPDPKDSKDRMPLSWAVQARYKIIVKLLFARDNVDLGKNTLTMIANRFGT